MGDRVGKGAYGIVWKSKDRKTGVRFLDAFRARALASPRGLNTDGVPPPLLAAPRRGLWR